MAESPPPLSATLSWDGCVGTFGSGSGEGCDEACADGVTETENVKVLVMFSNRCVAAVVGGVGVYHVRTDVPMDSATVQALSRSTPMKPGSASCAGRFMWDGDRGGFRCASIKVS